MKCMGNLTNNFAPYPFGNGVEFREIGNGGGAWVQSNR
jgi:hypothetical protein